MRIAAALILVMSVGLGVATACPPGPCLKYQRRQVEAEALQYRRTVRGVPPARFDRNAIARFLSSSAWIPEGIAMNEDTLPARTVRFFRADQQGRNTTDRVVIIRQIERRNGMTYVQIDDAFFTLTRCTDRRRMSACLNRAGALPEAESVNKFATPP
jgi:hypothetical protein